MNISEKIRIVCQFLGMGILLGVNIPDNIKPYIIIFAIIILLINLIILLANPY